jgi:hypothetical protein
MDRLTIPEQRFLVYYEEVTKKQIDWTYRSAMLALGYRSPGAIMMVIRNLRKKGYTIESERSSTLRAYREMGAEISEAEKTKLRNAVANTYNK